MIRTMMMMSLRLQMTKKLKIWNMEEEHHIWFLMLPGQVPSLVKFFLKMMGMMLVKDKEIREDKSRTTKVK